VPEPSTRATVRAASRQKSRQSAAVSRRGPWRSPALLAVTGLVLVGSLGGCTHKPDDAPLQDAAAQLASSLAGGSLDGVALTGATPADATAERKDVFAAVPVRPAVTVKHVARVKDHDDQATATLAWSWPVASGHPWTYTTTVHLAQGAQGASATSTGASSSTASPDPDDAWSVRWDPTVLLPDLADNQHVTFARVRPQRAKIVDGSGKAIVTDRAVHVIGVDKTRTSEAHWESSARALADALELDADAYAGRVAAAGPKAFVEAITLRTSDPTDVTKLTAIPGVVALDEKEPLAPTRDWARPLLGTVGDATAEIVKKSDGRVEAGDQTGLSGIQKQYDAQLAGRAGIEIRLVDDGDGGLSSGSDDSGDDKGTEVFAVKAADGTPVHLTLDSALQTDAEGILADQKVASAIVAVSTSGKVLAAASATAGNGLSTATTGRFAPGSTMKVASSLALLRQGATAATKVPCTPSITVDGRKFTNDADYPSSELGSIPLQTAFANSCNTAFISQAKKVDQQALHDAAADLGIGAPSALGVPAFFGSVPTTDGSETDHAASMIGQGRVEASPLTMATVAASVAAGKRVSPVLVEPSKAAAGAATASPTSGATATSAAPSKLTKGEAKTLHTFMRSVVTSGTGVILSSLPGDVGAKTGTAQFGDGGKAHAWMIATDGDVGVAVFVDEGEYGATTAGPLLKEFLQDLAKDRTSK